MRTLKLYVVITCLMLGVLSACGQHPKPVSKTEKHEVLVIYPDGSMEFRGRTISKEDVVIYPDGYGGERAAVKIRVEPLHPDFYRDTITVERVEVERSADKPATEPGD